MSHPTGMFTSHLCQVGKVFFSLLVGQKSTGKQGCLVMYTPTPLRDGFSVNSSSGRLGKESGRMGLRGKMQSDGKYSVKKKKGRALVL